MAQKHADAVEIICDRTDVTKLSALIHTNRRALARYERSGIQIIHRTVVTWRMKHVYWAYGSAATASTLSWVAAELL